MSPFSFVLFASFHCWENFHLSVEQFKDLRRRKEQTSFEDENGTAERME